MEFDSGPSVGGGRRSGQIRGDAHKPLPRHPYAEPYPHHAARHVIPVVKVGQPHVELLPATAILGFRKQTEVYVEKARPQEKERHGYDNRVAVKGGPEQPTLKLLRRAGKPFAERASECLRPPCRRPVHGASVRRCVSRLAHGYIGAPVRRFIGASVHRHVAGSVCGATEGVAGSHHSVELLPNEFRRATRPSVLRLSEVAARPRSIQPVLGFLWFSVWVGQLAHEVRPIWSVNAYRSSAGKSPLTWKVSWWKAKAAL
jgi:hypothetical protein